MYGLGLCKQKPKDQKISKQKEIIKMRYLVLEAIHKKGTLSRSEIEELTGWGPRTYDRNITFMLRQYCAEIFYNQHTKRIESLNHKSSLFEITKDWDSIEELIRGVKIVSTN